MRNKLFLVAGLILLLNPLLSLFANTNISAADVYDNPGIRLPYSSSGMSHIRIEEAYNYRQPSDPGNRNTPYEYSKYTSSCSTLDCFAHFPDSDRATSEPHKAIDIVDVKGGTFDVLAGVEGKVEVVYTTEKDGVKKHLQTVIVKAKVKGQDLYLQYTHINPTVKAGDIVHYTTSLGSLYQTTTDIWGKDSSGKDVVVDGINNIIGYCRPIDGEASHPLPGQTNTRCYPSHLDFRVSKSLNMDKFGRWTTYKNAIDPFGICGNLNGNDDKCKAYYYPLNRFDTAPVKLGSGKIDNKPLSVYWDLNSFGDIKYANEVHNCEDFSDTYDATFYTDTDCKNIAVRYTTTSGTINIPDTNDNKISSVKVRAGKSVKVFELKNATGASRCLDHSMWDLGKDYYTSSSKVINDTISSIQMFNNSTCSATPVSYKIEGASSVISIDANTVNLKVCGSNIKGKTVYVQMYRDAVGTNKAYTWNPAGKVATDTCVTFTDLDGAGPAFKNVTYYTVAGIQPLGANEASQKRTSCYAATSGTRLCDSTLLK